MKFKKWTYTDITEKDKTHFLEYNKIWKTYVLGDEPMFSCDVYEMKVE